MRKVLNVKRKALPSDAAKMVRSTFPGIRVKEMYDYDDGWYLVMATDKDKTDYNSPYYLVGKTNGRVCSFTPMFDLDKFSRVITNNRIEWR